MIKIFPKIPFNIMDGDPDKQSQFIKWRAIQKEHYPEVLVTKDGAPFNFPTPCPHPGIPNIDFSKERLTMREWEGVLLYYIECELHGFSVSYEDIARITDRPLTTVKQSLSKAAREILKQNP
jgi:hypothetical protein